MQLFKYLVLGVAFLFCSACGSGGGGADKSPSLIGGAVQGTPLPISGVVTTFAGRVGDTDGSGPKATFRRPNGVASDGKHLFVTDHMSHTIRKVDVATGEVTTVAGSPGVAGFVDGVGADARFDSPGGIATDGRCLYVADYNNAAIRRVAIATGEVTTLPVPAGQFMGPEGITTDGHNLFVADVEKATITKIVIGTGRTTTFAGGQYGGISDGIGTAAEFMRPHGITTDGTNLYVADLSAIRKIEIATAKVTTLATDLDLSYDYGGVATDGKTLYFADFENHRIGALSLATGQITTFAGTTDFFGYTDGTLTAATFDRPDGLVLVGDSLYVVDFRTAMIRKISVATGNVTTVAGCAFADGYGTAALFYSPTGITTDGTYLYVADSGSNTIRKVVTATGEVSTLAGTAGTVGSADGTGAAARFYFPFAITTDGKSVYVADEGNATIRKIVIDTGETTTLAGSPGTPRVSIDGTGASARFAYPEGITTDGTNLYVADAGDYTIRKVVIATGEVTTLAGSAGHDGTVDGIGAAAHFSLPQGMTTDGKNLYVTDWLTIRKIVIATGEVTTLAGSPDRWAAIDGIGASAGFSYLEGVTSDGTSLYATDGLIVRKIDLATRKVTTIAGHPARGGSGDGTGMSASFYYVSGITTDGRSLYVTDRRYDTIRKIE